jgi:hypothetical protein
VCKELRIEIRSHTRAAARFSTDLRAKQHAPKFSFERTQNGCPSNNVSASPATLPKRGRADFRPSVCEHPANPRTPMGADLPALARRESGVASAAPKPRRVSCF